MNLLAVLAVLLGAMASSACTTLTPKEETPEELQQQLLSGELLQPGERVRLVTTDESVYEFRITEIDLEQGLVIGDGERVPIADVVAAGSAAGTTAATAVESAGKRCRGPYKLEPVAEEDALPRLADLTWAGD